MEQKNKTVLVLYDKTAKELAELMIGRLEAEEILQRRKTVYAGIREDEIDMIWMDAQADIAMSAAIIFITERAVYCDEWQDAVNSVPSDFRRIPVCFPGDIDMKKIPKSLEEINFIPNDEHFFDNIRDSLMTDPAFYSEKNLLQIRWAQWARSGIDSNLLTDRKQIRSYEQDFREKLDQEKDKYLRIQLRNILDYLQASKRYCLKILLSTIGRWCFWAALITLAVLVVVKALPEYDRARRYKLRIDEDSDLYGPVSEIVITTELATNRYESSDTLYDAYLNMIEMINEPWPQSPIGLNYRQKILDISAPDGERYVWTSTDGGRVIVWDTYTGEPEETFLITDKALPVLAVSEDGENALACDESSMLYAFSDGSWNSTGKKTFLSVTEIDCEVRGDLALLHDGTSYELYRIGSSGITLQKKETFGQLYAACLSSEGELCLAAYKSENSLKISAPFCDGTDVVLQGETVILCDIREDQLAFCTASGKVFSVTGKGSCELPVMLTDPVVLKVIDGRTILYSDAEKGTHLFDTDAVYDYGQFFRKREKISGAWTERGTAVFDCGTILVPFSLSDILPMTSAGKETGGSVFDGKQCSVNSGSIREVSITSMGVVVAEGQFDGDEVHLVLDPAKFLFSENGYRDTTYFNDVPEGYSKYENVAGQLDGVPVTVGLLYVPAGDINNTDFSYILIGMDNGSFNEIAINNKNGGGYVTAIYTSPSHARIDSIRQVSSGYILTDATGREWFVRSGIDSETRSGMYELVKDKLHCGVSEALMQVVSEETVQRLGLTVCPGMDGKEWD